MWGARKMRTWGTQFRGPPAGWLPLKLLYAVLEGLCVICLALRVEALCGDDRRLISGAGFILFSEGGRRVSQRPLWVQLARCQLYCLLGKRQRLLRLVRLELLIGKECPAQAASLFHVHIAPVDEDAVVDLVIRLQRLKTAVGIHLPARPQATLYFRGAQQNGSVNDGWDGLRPRPAHPVGQDVAMDSVDLRANEGAYCVGKPAIFAWMPVLPLLHLIKLSAPVDVGVVENSVGVPGPSPGFVGIGKRIWEDAQRRGDM